MAAVMDLSVEVRSAIDSELGEGVARIEKTDVWLDVFGSRNIASFSSLPSVVTWNHWGGMQCLIGNNVLKGNEQIFSSFPSVVTWIQHCGLKLMETNSHCGLIEKES
eukprot:3757118-Rhodomonas_salina.1